MCGENVLPNGQDPSQHPPPPGTLMVDTSRKDRVGEFRGVAGPYWALRPVRGGVEWEADPEHLRPATRIERLRAETARRNARSEGRLL
ncbi:hypothetical protein AB0L68_28500 [Streptomyces sp. NPDC052164]|uniref:hypothetical protein n=1 Tax=Streptomyces sp. NPDC052164 TaxID=3155529 RepID=UPI00342A805F